MKRLLLLFTLFQTSILTAQLTDITPGNIDVDGFLGFLLT